MKRENLDDHLMHFYSSRAPAPDTTDRLLALAAHGQTNRRRAPRTWTTRKALALTALIALVVVGGTLLVTLPRSERPDRDNDRAPNLASQTPETIPSAAPPPTTMTPPTRLVAVKFHYDGCPISAAAETHFAAMREKYANESVLFTTLDITDYARQRQSLSLAKALGIECVYEDGQSGSGTLKLVDVQRHEVLATAAEGREIERWEDALAHAVTP